MNPVKNFLIFVSLLMVSVVHSTFAQASTHAFSVVQGSVVVTPAWCRVSPCTSTVAALSGSFVAQVSADGQQILFPSSSLVTTPDVYFQLPTDPKEDSNGVVRDISFGFDGNTLEAKGFVDSRAFDGPLVEYKFVASVARSEVFTARPDYRKCAAPLCGGYFVKLVNKKLTRCADGSLQEECYVGSVVYGDGLINAPAAAFNNRTPLLLIGSIVTRPNVSIRNLGVFIAKDAYRSATQNSATGNFYGINNNGIMCITTPCFSYDQVLLNSANRITKLSDVNLEMSGALPQDIQQAHILLANGGALYATGKNEKYDGFAGTGVRFVAQQFYLPLKPTVVEK